MSDEPKDNIKTINAEFTWKVPCDSCFINYWSRNRERYFGYSLTLDNKPNYSKGYFAMDYWDFEDSIWNEKSKTFTPRIKVISAINNLLDTKTPTIQDFTQFKNTKHFLKRLKKTKNKVKFDTYGFWYDSIQLKDLHDVYYTFNMKIKVEKHPIEFMKRQIIYVRHNKIHMKSINVPIYKVVAVDSIW